jgi:hypothetical protein
MCREDELRAHRHHGRPGFAACRRSFTTAAADRRRLPSMSMVMQAASPKPLDTTSHLSSTGGDLIVWDWRVPHSNGKNLAVRAAPRPSSRVAGAAGARREDDADGPATARRRSSNHARSGATPSNHDAQPLSELFRHQSLPAKAGGRAKVGISLAHDR